MPPKRPAPNSCTDSSDSDSCSSSSTNLSKRGKKENWNRKIKGDEYIKRRERNNIAVRKSRDKSRLKAKETVEKVVRLREENQMLQQKIQILSKELSVLKDLFLAHASTVAEGQCNVNDLSQGKKAHTDHEYSVTHKPQK